MGSIRVPHGGVAMVNKRAIPFGLLALLMALTGSAATLAVISHAPPPLIAIGSDPLLIPCNSVPKDARPIAERAVQDATFRAFLVPEPVTSDCGNMMSEVLFNGHRVALLHGVYTSRTIPFTAAIVSGGGGWTFITEGAQNPRIASVRLVMGRRVLDSMAPVSIYGDRLVVLAFDAPITSIDTSSYVQYLDRQGKVVWFSPTPP
jgi:hypothetical protein